MTDKIRNRESSSVMHRSPEEYVYVALLIDHYKDIPDIFVSKKRMKAISWARLKAEKYRTNGFSQQFRKEDHPEMDLEYVEIYGEQHHDRAIVKEVLVTDRVNISGEFDFKI